MTFDVAKYLAADAEEREIARGVMRSFVEAARDQYVTTLLCEAGVLTRELMPEAYVVVFHVREWSDDHGLYAEVVAVLRDDMAEVPPDDMADDLTPIADFLTEACRHRDARASTVRALHIDSATLSYGRPDGTTP